MLMERKAGEEGGGEKDGGGERDFHG